MPRGPLIDQYVASLVDPQPAICSFYVLIGEDDLAYILIGANKDAVKSGFAVDI